MNPTDVAIGFGHAGLLILIALAVLLAVRFAADRITPFDDAHEVEVENNLAASLARAGLYVSVVIGTMGALSQTGLLPFADEVIGFTVGGVMAALAAIVGQWLLRKILLPGIRLREAVANKNTSVGLVELAFGFATGLITFGAFAGGGGTYLTAAVFVLVGLLALGATVMILDRLTGGCVADVQAGSVPAGILLSGHVASVGILLMNAINGPSFGWVADLGNVAIWFGVGIVFNVVADLLVDWLFLPKSRKADWVREGRIAPAFLQTSVHVALAALVALAI